MSTEETVAPNAPTEHVGESTEYTLEDLQQLKPGDVIERKEAPFLVRCTTNAFLAISSLGNNQLIYFPLDRFSDAEEASATFPSVTNLWIAEISGETQKWESQKDGSTREDFSQESKPWITLFDDAYSAHEKILEENPGFEALRKRQAGDILYLNDDIVVVDGMIEPAALHFTYSNGVRGYLSLIAGKAPEGSRDWREVRYVARAKPVEMIPESIAGRADAALNKSPWPTFVS